MIKDRQYLLASYILKCMEEGIITPRESDGGWSSELLLGQVLEDTQELEKEIREKKKQGKL